MEDDKIVDIESHRKNNGNKNNKNNNKDKKKKYKNNKVSRTVNTIALASLAVLVVLIIALVISLGGKRHITLQGIYTVIRDGAEVPLGEKFKYMPGDRVMSASGNDVSIYIDDNKIIALRNECDVAVSAKGTKSSGNVVVDILKGDISITAAESARKTEFAVTLPHMAADFKGASVDVTVNEEFEEICIKTETATIIANGETVTLNAGDACLYRDGEVLYGEKAMVDKYIAAEEETTLAAEEKAEAEALWTMHDTDLSAAEVGDIVYFGRYEQDGQTEKTEPIAWDVIGKEDGKLLLISHMALATMPYNNIEEPVTWETSSLRKWLNEEFYYDAFSENEMACIVTTAVDDPDSYDFYDAFYENGSGNPGLGVQGGNTVNDKVFILSYQEVIDYIEPVKLGNGWWRYASEKLIKKSTITCGQDNYTFLQWDYDTFTKTEPDWPEASIGKTGCNWWLRSPADTRTTALNVSYYGYVTGGSYITSEYGVCPAIWVTY